MIIRAIEYIIGQTYYKYKDGWGLFDIKLASCMSNALHIGIEKFQAKKKKNIGIEK